MKIIFGALYLWSATFVFASAPLLSEEFKRLRPGPVHLEKMEVGKAIEQLFDAARRSTGEVNEINILVLQAAADQPKVTLDLAEGSLAECLDRIASLAGWKTAYTDHALIMGPAQDVDSMLEVLKKKPVASPEQIPRRMRIEFHYSSAQQFAEFLNEKAGGAEQGGFHLEVKNHPKRTVLMFAQKIVVYEAIWLVSASLGGDPIEIFGERALPK